MKLYIGTSASYVQEYDPTIIGIVRMTLYIGTILCRMGGVLHMMGPYIYRRLGTKK